MKTSQPAMMPVPPEDTESSESPALSGHGPACIITMCNQKGGVGKITTAINLSAALTGYGRRVLLVDSDPQGAALVGLGINGHELDSTIYSLMLSDHHNMATCDMIQSTDTENLGLVPANIDLSAIELQLVSKVARKTILVRALRDAEQDYDLIVIDCQPLLGLLATNALTVAHKVIIPAATEFFTPCGVVLLIEMISTVHDRLNLRLQLGGILATIVGSRTLYSKKVFERLIEAFQDKVLSTITDRTVELPDSTMAAHPTTEFMPTHNGAEAYRRLACEVVTKGYVT